ncbi:MAG: FtsQ-type POTRA domain-containing protein [Limnochordaceae bacterium]|nr:FtsQ-type POTRA domain-containing protein [Limnochordaceae bacterium]
MQEIRRQMELPASMPWPRPWRGIWAAVLLLAALAVVLSSTVFAVRRIDVVGAKAVPAQQIRALAGIRLGTPLLWVNPGAARERLLRHPRLAAARIDRYWDGRVVIHVEERRAVALIQAGSDWLVLDQKGVPFALAGSQEAADLPILTYEGYTEVLIGHRLTAPWLSQALAVLAALPPSVARQVSEVHMGDEPERPVRLYLNNLLAVDLPLEQGRYASALQLLAAILPHLAGYGAGWIVDVGAPGGATVRREQAGHGNAPVDGGLVKQGQKPTGADVPTVWP